ncbi:MAG: M13 family metallopeptidase, partial [Bacteroidota bacterium]|nr:M13 family metallopeptidase [Bacteroidota bacterium]MDX5430394.1 M13 family metallopeptidase [Bacteroidota bacterium]MDX5469153.1 M13 family metallopeptidase [Bacteroidota bacterium]
MKYLSKHWILGAGILASITFLAFRVHTEWKGYDQNQLNRSVNPCEDFYGYAIGGWQKNNPIPSTESRWGVFNILAKQNEDRIQGILEGLNNGKVAYPKGSTEQQVRDFYRSALDSAMRNQRGIEPIKEQLKQIESAKDKTQLSELLAAWRPEGMGTFFSVYVGSDAKNSEVNRLHISQSGLHLPDRDYYLKEDSSNQAIREAYRSHLETMLQYVSPAEKATNQASEI